MERYPWSWIRRKRDALMKSSGLIYRKMMNHLISIIAVKKTRTGYCLINFQLNTWLERSLSTAYHIKITSLVFVDISRDTAQRNRKLTKSMIMYLICSSRLVATLYPCIILTFVDGGWRKLWMNLYTVSLLHNIDYLRSSISHNIISRKVTKVRRFMISRQIYM